MLETIRIRNFKALKDVEFQLANLTLVAGLNCTGKSSFIQALLLLRQSFEQGIINRDGLLLNGKYTDIGIGKDALCIDAEEDSFFFDLEWGNGTCLSLTFDYGSASNLQPLHKLEPKSYDFNASLFNTSFKYLAAERIGPKNVFPVSDYDINILKSLGKHGEYTVHYLFENGSKPLAITGLYHKNAKSDTLLAQVDAWMSDISPGVKITANLIPEINQASLRYAFETKDGYTEKFRPENVGFGLTYVLPVVTATLSANPGDLLIIENPEAHLHPAGQSAIAALLARAAQEGVQIIVETHSDHVLNGLRVAVKKEIIEPENVALFYFSREEDAKGHHIEMVQPFIGKDGRLDEWPKGFFDEWDKQLDRLLEE